MYTYIIYTILNGYIFSLTLLMKDILSHCDETIAQTKQNIRETETDLKNVTAKEEYIQIEKTIKTNEAKKKKRPSTPM